MQRFLRLAVLLALGLGPCGAGLGQEAEVPLPRERPDAMAGETPDAAAGAAGAAAGARPTVAEPAAPPRDYQLACPAVLDGEVVATPLPPIEEDMCRVQSPLSLEAVIAGRCRSMRRSPPIAAWPRRCPVGSPMSTAG